MSIDATTPPNTPGTPLRLKRRLGFAMLALAWERLWIRLWLPVTLTGYP